MGLCIYYRGEFNDSKSLGEMIEEVRDVAKAYNWKYNVFEDSLPDNDSPHKSITAKLYGISLWPEKCEPVYFAFFSNREMGSVTKLHFYGELEKEDKNLGWICTKTQYAGIAVHKVIIHLYDYISEKYFTEFEMIDESKYWETREDEVMKKNFDRFNFVMDQIDFYLENKDRDEEESLEDYLVKLMEIINKNMN